MSKVYTLTLNPAYDVHAYARHFEPFHENLAQIQSRDAGGKGVNISRALQKNGVVNTAVIVLGRDNCVDFKADLAQAGLDTVLLEKPGRIRENLTIHCDAQPETRISFSGFSVDDSILAEMLQTMQVDADTIVTFTGRVPNGVSMESAKEFLAQLKSLGARIVLDSRSFSLADIFAVQPWLIKPNQEEISEYFTCPVKTVEDAMSKAKVFADQGVANVMISLGEQGALLHNQGKCYIAAPPKVEAVSTIGAGDSAIAGFIAADMAGCTPEECLKMAVSYGTAACLSAGSMPPERKAVEEIYRQVSVRQVECAVENMICNM